MSNRVINFNPGPSTISLSVLEQAQKELLDYQGSGMSIMEHSHRGKQYDAVHGEAVELTRELLGVPDNYEVLLIQGGASLQFAMVPMNFISKGGCADYVLTGSWSKKALQEAKNVAEVRAIDMAQDGKFLRVANSSDLNIPPDSAYVHITSNNTIAGTQYFDFPDTGGVPLVADMSSDIMWRDFDVSKFGLVYAGAQKNLGPAGIALVIVRKELVEGARKDIPKILRYSTFAEANSLQNTPPTFVIYMVRNVLQSYKARGGLGAIEKENREKAALLYDLIDANPDYFRCPVDRGSRSVMNIVFRLPSEDLEKKFIAEATSAGLVGLKGHRSVGGCRASTYNAMTRDGMQKLCDFMEGFRKANPA